jgi:hypothetical protein
MTCLMLYDIRHMALEAFCFGLMIYLYPRLVLAF